MSAGLVRKGYIFRRMLPQSVRLKLILGVAVVHLVLMSGFVTDLVVRQKSFLLHAAKTRAVNDARLIADTASSWVVADDLVGMEEVLESSARKGNNLRYAMIVSPRGRVLAHTERSKIGMYLHDPVSRRVLTGEQKARLMAVNADTIYSAAPIVMDRHLVGWSLVGLDTTATISHLRYVTRTGIYYMLAAVVVGTIFAVLLARSILGQLGLVLKGIDRLGKDVLDEPIPVVTTDEVGTVALALNESMQSLREGRNRLQQEMEERKKAEEEIRDLSRRLMGIIETERKRISQDLHDDFGQVLIGMKFRLQALEEMLPKNSLELKKKCKECFALVDQMGRSIHAISVDLRPPALDHFGLAPVVESLVEEIEHRDTGLSIELQMAGFNRRLDPEIELVCYRIIQESLTNIVKHAKAKHVYIVLTVSHPNVILMIKDDGCGVSRTDFPELTSSVKGIGLLGMKERAASVGGVFQVQLGAGGGTVIRVELPVAVGLI